MSGLILGPFSGAGTEPGMCSRCRAPQERRTNSVCNACCRDLGLPENRASAPGEARYEQAMALLRDPRIGALLALKTLRKMIHSVLSAKLESSVRAVLTGMLNVIAEATAASKVEKKEEPAPGCPTCDGAPPKPCTTCGATHRCDDESHRTRDTPASSEVEKQEAPAGQGVAAVFMSAEAAEAMAKMNDELVKRWKLRRDLAEVLNRHGVDSRLNTPDLELAERLVAALFPGGRDAP